MGASLKTFIDYIAFSTLPVPENQGEASSLIQMYKGGAKDYESSLAGHERLHSKGAWAAARRFENDAAFQTELANFIESHDKPASDLLRIDTVFRSEILDPFRARDV